MSDAGHLMLEWFSLQSDPVKSYATVVDQDTVGQDYFLHIDKQTPVEFTPRMPPSASDGEDITCPRITVAPTLWGCYIGYNRAHDDMFAGSKRDPEDQDPYRGGYEICTLPFEYALKVDSQLVPDARRSGEHWLVAYSEDTRTYTPVKIGKIFAKKFLQEAVTGQVSKKTLELWVSVQKPEGIKFSPNIHLDAGYWCITVTWSGALWPMVTDEKGIALKAVSEDDWIAAKGLSAAMLSLDTPPAPKYMAW